jgi:hypothetical protein
MWVTWNLVLVCLEIVLVLVHLEIVLILRKIGARFAPNVHRIRKLFWTHPMEHLGDEAQVEAHFGPFGGSANLDAR